MPKKLLRLGQRFIWIADEGFVTQTGSFGKKNDVIIIESVEFSYQKSSVQIKIIPHSGAAQKNITFFSDLDLESFRTKIAVPETVSLQLLPFSMERLYQVFIQYTSLCLNHKKPTKKEFGILDDSVKPVNAFDIFLALQDTKRYVRTRYHHGTISSSTIFPFVDDIALPKYPEHYPVEKILDLLLALYLANENDSEGAVLCEWDRLSDKGRYLEFKLFFAAFVEAVYGQSFGHVYELKSLMYAGSMLIDCILEHICS